MHVHLQGLLGHLHDWSLHSLWMLLTLGHSSLSPLYLLHARWSHSLIRMRWDSLHLLWVHAHPSHLIHGRNVGVHYARPLERLLLCHQTLSISCSLNLQGHFHCSCWWWRLYRWCGLRCRYCLTSRLALRYRGLRLTSSHAVVGRHVRRWRRLGLGLRLGLWWSWGLGLRSLWGAGLLSCWCSGSSATRGWQALLSDAASLHGGHPPAEHLGLL